MNKLDRTIHLLHDKFFKKQKKKDNDYEDLFVIILKAGDFDEETKDFFMEMFNKIKGR